MSSPDGPWRPDGRVTLAGVVGGDIQRGRAYTIRFARSDVPAAEINTTFYAIEYDELPGEYSVQRQVEFMIRDAGGDDAWSETTYDNVSEFYSYTIGAAEREAAEHARAELGRGWTHRWDGQPDYSNGAS